MDTLLRRNDTARARLMRACYGAHSNRQIDAELERALLIALNDGLGLIEGHGDLVPCETLEYEDAGVVANARTTVEWCLKTIEEHYIISREILEGAARTLQSSDDTVQQVRATAEEVIRLQSEQHNVQLDILTMRLQETELERDDYAERLKSGRAAWTEENTELRRQLEALSKELLGARQQCNMWRKEAGDWRQEASRTEKALSDVIASKAAISIGIREALRLDSRDSDIVGAVRKQMEQLQAERDNWMTRALGQHSSGLQVQVFRAVEERGDFEGWGLPHLVARHITKLTEELGAAADHVYLGSVLDDALIELQHTAHDRFNQLRLSAWSGCGPDDPKNYSRIIDELVDCQVALCVAACAMGLLAGEEVDLLNLAYKKALSDAKEGNHSS